MVPQIDSRTKKDIFIQNLIGGIGWGIGSVVGATLIVGVLGTAILRSQNIPIIGKYISEISQVINTNKPK